MNTVNIRIVPINRAHRGGLVIMSKKIKHDTGKKTKTQTVSEKSTGQGQRDRGYGRRRRTPTQTKEDRVTEQQSKGGRDYDKGTHSTRHQERQTERGNKYVEDRQGQVRSKINGKGETRDRE